MTSVDVVRSFADASQIVRIGPTTFRAELDTAWGYEDKLNGGYLQAIMARAALATADHTHVISVNSLYLSAPDAGSATLDTEILRRGTSSTQLRVRLSTADEPRIEALITLGTLPPTVRPKWHGQQLAPIGLPFGECEPHAPPADVVSVPLMHQVDLRLEPGSLEFYRGRPRGRGELRGWLALPRDNDRLDPVSLLFAVDVMPPPTFDIAFTGWVPTYSMTTYVRALPAPGPVQIVMCANLVQGNRVDETCTVRDRTGVIVAQAHQLAGVRLP